MGTGVGVVRQQPRNWELEIGSKFHHRIAVWWASLLIYFVECFGIGELYETLTDLFKFNSRPLSKQEITLAKNHLWRKSELQSHSHR